jgi:hypothetical protein
MDWAGAIRINREALLTIVTSLFVLAGIRTGRAVAALPRSLRISILAMLRPAEFAVRRLIVMAARGVEVRLRPVMERERRAASSVILGLDPRAHSVEAEPTANDRRSGCVLHLRGFRGVSGMGSRVKPENDGLCRASRLTAEPLPAFALFDPFKRFGHPWLEDGEDDQAGAWLYRETELGPDDPVGASGICRRIRVLERALQDLEGQAMRLARWRARRDRETCKPKRFSPLRPGRPPGWRKRPKTAVEEVLKECHFLARDAWNTS